MSALNLTVPTHLSIFVTDPDTGRPVTRLPLYAEVAVPRIVPLPPINERFRAPMRAALFEADPTPTVPAVRDRVETAALQALADTVGEASRNQLVTRPERVRELFQQVFKEVLDAATRERMADIPPANLKSLIVAALRRVGPELGLGMTPEVEDLGMIWADPLGVLTTDHVGYVSFDLRRLRPDMQVLLEEAIEARRNDPDAVSKLAIWIYPYGHPGRFDALSSGALCVRRRGRAAVDDLEHVAAGADQHGAAGAPESQPHRLATVACVVRGQPDDESGIRCAGKA